MIIDDTTEIDVKVIAGNRFVLWLPGERLIDAPNTSYHLIKYYNDYILVAFYKTLFLPKSSEYKRTI